MNLTIDALHPEILRSYRGVVQGDDATGLTDIEFPSLRHATAWAETCEISDLVKVRADSAGRVFALPVVVQYARNVV